MTWNPRDSIPRTPQTTSGTRGRGRRATVEESFAPQDVPVDGRQAPPAVKGLRPYDTEEALPTFANAMDDDEDIVRLPGEVEQMWNTMGMMSDRQWDAWAYLCRRGVHEV